MTHQIVTANRLHDGAVVYLAKDHDWTRNIASGFPAEAGETENLMVAAVQAVQAQIIMAPYLIDVEIGANAIHPLRFREQIRAKGPTIFSAPAK